MVKSSKLADDELPLVGQEARMVAVENYSPAKMSDKHLDIVLRKEHWRCFKNLIASEKQCKHYG